MARTIRDGMAFKLGLFSANCSSGLAVTRIPERWSGSWEDNLRLARLADEVGIDFLLPIARWIGYGGDTNFHEGVLDPVASAAALLAHTRRITVFSTVHTAFNHPVVTAKPWTTSCGCRACTRSRSPRRCSRRSGPGSRPATAAAP